MTRPLTFGLLTVRGRFNSKRQRHIVCICVCRCGRTLYVRRADLLSGHVTACGCRRRIHGMNRTRSWQTWQAMRRRCRDPKYQAYPNYGGRGISVCARWNDARTGFVAFLADMGARPEGMTIDRKDPHSNYSCGHCLDCVSRGWDANCRWATLLDQAANRRRYVKYFWNQEMQNGGSEGAEREHWDQEERAWMNGGGQRMKQICRFEQEASR